MTYSKGAIGRFSDAPALGSAKASRWVDEPGVRHRARLFVAVKATGVEDCRLLLDALGLGPTPEEVAEWRAANEQDTPVNHPSLPVEATER